MLTGRCKCGAVSFRGERSDLEGFRCYCRDCQQLTGTGHSEMLPLRADSFDISGPVREFEMKGESGRSTWSSFCTICGCPITRRSQKSAHRVYVHAGALDDPTTYDPKFSIYTDTAQPWDAPESK